MKMIIFEVPDLVIFVVAKNQMKINFFLTFKLYLPECLNSDMFLHPLEYLKKEK